MARVAALAAPTRKTARGRPRSFDIDTAVRTAQTLFQEKGYAGVSTAMLSAAIGISPPSLYAAFGSKGQLFGRVVERYLATEGSFFVHALAEPSASRLVRRLLADAATAYAVREESAGCLVMNGLHDCDDPVGRSAVVAVRSSVRRQIVAALARYTPTDAAEVAELLGIAMAGLSSAARDGAGAAALTRFADVAANGIVEVFGLR